MKPDGHQETPRCRRQMFKSPKQGDRRHSEVQVSNMALSRKSSVLHSEPPPLSLPLADYSDVPGEEPHPLAPSTCIDKDAFGRATTAAHSANCCLRFRLEGKAFVLVKKKHKGNNFYSPLSSAPAGCTWPRKIIVFFSFS